MKLAISYVRFSSPMQLEGDSLRRQTEKTAQFCLRHNLTLDPSLTYRDLMVSGFKGHNARKGTLKDFLELVKAGRIPRGATLVIESLDRLGRDQIMPSVRLIGSILEAGINVATLTPERIYTEQSANDLGTHIEIVVTVSRAYEESATKSVRCKDAWMQKRKRIGDGHKLSSVCPQWLKLREDRSGYDVIPERADAIRKAFQMACDGIGAAKICQVLNASVKTDKGKDWRSANLLKLLRGRAVLGEYQPRLWEGKSFRPAGDPVPNYFPAIVSVDLYARAQLALDGRATPTGRHSRQTVNLFKGLLWEADLRQPLVILTNREKLKDGSYKFRLRLVPGKGVSNGDGVAKKMFRYEVFESAFLRFVRELRASDFAGSSFEDAERLASESSKLTLINEKIEKVEAEMGACTEADDMPLYLDVLKKLRRDRESARKALADAKIKASNPTVETLADAQSLISLLESAPDPSALRMKIRARIRQLVKEIWILVKDGAREDGFPPARYAYTQVFFHDGTVRWFVCSFGLTRAKHEIFEVPGKLVPLEGTYDLRKLAE